MRTYVSINKLKLHPVENDLRDDLKHSGEGLPTSLRLCYARPNEGPRR